MKTKSVWLFSALLCLLLSGLMLAGCKKDDVTPPPPPPPPSSPAISGFSPSADTLGATITITGTNFSPDISANIVKMNGVVATVISSTATQIKIKVPLGMVNGNITVTLNAKTATSSGTFTLLGFPSITAFSPSISGIGYPVTITGKNFSADPNSNIVTINGVPASVVSATDTLLVITVPLTASTGKISVTVKEQAATSSSDLTIKKLVVTTIAGSGNLGYSDGTGVGASFNNPSGITTDHNGNFYIADAWNQRIRKVTSAGVVTTLAGSGIEGNKDGFGDTATFSYPAGMAMDSHGNLFVTDLNGNTIRKIVSMGLVSTFAGSVNMAQGTADGTGTAARFFSPAAMVIDANDNIYVAEANNALIRKITPAGVVSTFAGSGNLGSADGNGTAASFNSPFGMVMDPNGNLFVVDQSNNNIRKITPSGDVTTFAGSGIDGSVDGPALSARFDGPIGIVRDQNGNFFVLEQGSAKIRMITPDGFVVTLAGGDTNYLSVDGAGKFAGFSFPRGITMDTDGVMYVTDSYSGTIRKVVVQ